MWISVANIQLFILLQFWILHLFCYCLCFLISSETNSSLSNSKTVPNSEVLNGMPKGTTLFSNFVFYIRRPQLCCRLNAETAGDILSDTFKSHTCTNLYKQWPIFLNLLTIDLNTTILDHIYVKFKNSIAFISTYSWVTFLGQNISHWILWLNVFLRKWKITDVAPILNYNN